MRTMLTIMLGACSVVGAIFGIPLAAQEKNYLKVSLCEVGSAPEKYDNELISVAAQYESDGMEREGLSDASCANQGLGLQIGRKTEGRAALEAALHGGYPGTLDKIVTGTFIGIFHWKPGDHPPRILEVQRIEDIVAKRTGLPPTMGTQPSAQSSSPGSTSLHESGHVDPPKQR